MKSFILIITVWIVGLVYSNKIQNKIKVTNANSIMMFTSESKSEKENKNKPTLMNEVISKKEIKVNTRFSIVGEENRDAEENSGNGESIRFKENENFNNIDFKNMESPTMVKSLGYPETSVMDKVAGQSTQVISNRQAYDTLYPSHNSWYNEKRFIVLDKNFEDMEKYLLNEFKQTLEKQFDFTETKKTKHVDELDQNKINLTGIDFGAMPKINPESVKYNTKYSDNFTGSNLKVTYSDPYKEIFGGN